MIDIGHDPKLPFQGYKYRKAATIRKPIGPVPIENLHIFTFTNRFNQKYIVNIEKYAYDVYIIKFHLKKVAHHKNKYQLLTGNGDAGRVLATCLKILIDEILQKNEIASFGFLGMNSVGEGKSRTKRFSLYKRIVADYFSRHRFEHLVNERKSAYVLLNRQNTIPDLKQKVEVMFRVYYPALEED